MFTYTLGENQRMKKYIIFNEKAFHTTKQMDCLIFILNNLFFTTAANKFTNLFATVVKNRKTKKNK